MLCCLFTFDEYGIVVENHKRFFWQGQVNDSVDNMHMFCTVAQLFHGYVTGYCYDLLYNWCLVV